MKKNDSISYLRLNRKVIRFSYLEVLLRKNGWILKNVRGSHYIFSKEGSLPMLIVKPHGRRKYCHPFDVDKVIMAIEKGNTNESR